MKILFIDLLSEPIQTTIPLGEDQGFAIEHVNTIHATSEKIHLYEYDCILLCCSLQDTSTKTLLLDISANAGESGLIILSIENSVTSKILALNAGADDCMSIPYHPEELNARILAVIRRKKFNARDKIHLANMVIDISAQQIFIWNTLLWLTRTEYDVLLYFVMNRNKTIAHNRIADYLWGEDAEYKEASNLLITHIKNLRKKLVLAKAELEIKNVYGVGYTLIEL